MAEPAFTPGPWEARWDGVVVIRKPNQHGYQQPVKLISPWREGAWDGDGEAEANAALIAAAPRLYAAADYALGVLSTTNVFDAEQRQAAVDELTEALSLALGEKQDA